jgi:hypothetical protein
MSDFKFEVWPTEFRHINQYFGANPQNYAQFGLPGHEGVDVYAPGGSKVFAVAAGRVGFVRTAPTGHNYGIHVRVDHQDNYQTIYAHLQQALVQVGQVVQAGTVLGLADNTGNSFGDHLHLTLKKIGSNYQNWPHNIHDPLPFLLPLIGWQTPAGPYTDGWAYTAGIFIMGNLAQANVGGINLRSQPSTTASQLALVPGGTLMIVNGAARGSYTPVRVPNASIGITPAPTPTPEPTPEPSPMVLTVDGWAVSTNLTVSGDRAVVGQFGVNFRVAPSENANIIAVVREGSSVTVLGGASGRYLPIRASRADLTGNVVLPEPPLQLPTPLTGHTSNAFLGWAASQFLLVTGGQAVVNSQVGVNLRARPSSVGQVIGVVKGFANVTIAGQKRDVFTPILVRRTEVTNAANPAPAPELPDPIPGGQPVTPPPPPPQPMQDTTPGWAFSTQLVVTGNTAAAGQWGINLRDAPRRDATNIGFIPAGTAMVISGGPQGEYTPVRVDRALVQPVFGTTRTTTTPTPTTTPTTTPTPVAPPPDPEPTPLGQARIGLHAAADPFISEAEFQEFAAARPGMIKVLSFHAPEAIRRLAQQHPDARWVVRACLDFGGRNISPDQFLNDTLSDVRRSLDQLPGKDVVVELHNEPNLVPEGLGASWADGGAFGAWWSSVLAKYRQALPGVRFIYPGLSPGSAVSGLKHDHIQFIEASRRAVEAADGLGVHIYWSSVYPMTTAIGVLDDYISRFRFKPIWVTEASNNKAGTSASEKGRQYLNFWQQLQRRATVQGVTYFVASASNQEFAEEVWVGRGIGAVVGRR